MGEILVGTRSWTAPMVIDSCVCEFYDAKIMIGGIAWTNKHERR